MLVPGFSCSHRRRCATRVCRWFGLCTCLVLLSVGCSRDEIKVYKVSKESSDESTSTAPAPGSGQATGPNAPPPQSRQPHVHWENLPDHWQEESPGGMRVASFSISGQGGQQAEVSVVPLQGVSGIAQSSVNMWRKELGLPHWSEEEFGAAGEMIQIGANEGMLYDLAGQKASESGDSNPTRIVGAVLPHQSATWFFKMIGNDELVAREKSNLVELLKTFEFHGAGAHSQNSSSGTPPTTPTAPAAPGDTASGPVSDAGQSSSSLPVWDVPSGWREQSPGSSMIQAQFATGGDQETGQAEVTVTSFPGDVGGLLANINRWRRQVRLPPIGQSELSEHTTSLDLGGREATLADIKGEAPEGGEPATRVVVGIVPHGGKTWFYKLMGDGPAVAREKDALIEFVKSVRYSNAQ